MRMSVSRTAICIAILFVLAADVAADAPVRVEPVSTRTIIQQINVSGSVTSPRSAVLSTAVAGLVAEILVDEGYHVEAGDILLSLDAHDNLRFVAAGVYSGRGHRTLSRRWRDRALRHPRCGSRIRHDAAGTDDCSARVARRQRAGSVTRASAARRWPGMT